MSDCPNEAEEVEKYTDVTMSNTEVDEKDKLSLEEGKEIRHGGLLQRICCRLWNDRFHTVIARLHSHVSSLEVDPAACGSWHH